MHPLPDPASVPQLFPALYFHCSTHARHRTWGGSTSLKLIFWYPFWSGTINLLTRESASCSTCSSKQSCVIRSVGKSFWHNRNSIQPLWLAVSSTTTVIVSPGWYFRTIMPLAYLPPGSCGRGPFQGSPQTPHRPPFCSYWTWTEISLIIIIAYSDCLWCRDPIGTPRAFSIIFGRFFSESTEIAELLWLGATGKPWMYRYVLPVN